MATIERRRDERGETTYRVKVRLQGYPPATRSFTKLAAAKAWAAATESSMRDGHYAAGSGRTIAEAIDAYVTKHLPSLKDQRMRRAHLLWWRQALGHVRLRDLTAAQIAGKLDGLEACPQPAKRAGGEARRRSGATVNRYRAAISAVLTFAAAQNPPWITGNPARRTEHRHETTGRVRFLSPEERGALLDAARKSRSHDLYLAVVLSLATGGRQSEILGLRWPCIDLGRAVVLFEHTKNGDTRSVPLPREAVALLRERRREAGSSTELVFPSCRDSASTTDLRSAFRAACLRAGIREFRWHDQRHSAASALADMGASLLDIGAVLGHRSQQTTRRYAHLTESRLRDLVTKAAQKHRVV